MQVGDLIKAKNLELDFLFGLVLKLEGRMFQVYWLHPNRQGPQVEWHWNNGGWEVIKRTNKLQENSHDT